MVSPTNTGPTASVIVWLPFLTVRAMVYGPPTGTPTSLPSANLPPSEPGPPNLAQLIGRNIRMEGFIVSHHWDMMPTFLDELSGWVKDGKVTWKETVFEGIEKAPDAFVGLFRGENLGKMLVKLA